MTGLEIAVLIASVAAMVLATVSMKTKNKVDDIAALVAKAVEDELKRRQAEKDKA